MCRGPRVVGSRFYQERVAPLGFYCGSGVPEWLPFWSILEVLGIQMAPILVGFGDLVASLGAYGAPFAPGLPGVFPPPSLFSDFAAERDPKGVPKWSQNAEKVSPKIDAKIDVILDGPFERLWSTLGVFLGPWSLED